MDEGRIRSARWRQMLLVIVSALVVLTGCTKTQQVLVREPSPPQETIEGRWALKSLGPVASEISVLDSPSVFIVFASDGKLSGSGGCNHFFGGWGYLEERKDAIRIWGTGSTRMSCPEPVMVQEHLFLEDITRVSRYEITGRELRLYHDEGRKIMRFTRSVTP